MEEDAAVRALMFAPMVKEVASAMPTGSAGKLDAALRPSTQAEPASEDAKRKARENRAKREALRSGMVPAWEEIRCYVPPAAVTCTEHHLPARGASMFLIDVEPGSWAPCGAMVVEYNSVAAKRYGTAATTIFRRPMEKPKRDRVRRAILHLAALPGKLARRVLWQGTTFRQLVQLLQPGAPKLARAVKHMCGWDAALTTLDTPVADWCGYVCRVNHVKTYGKLLLKRIGSQSLAGLAKHTRKAFLRGQARRKARHQAVARAG